MSMTSSDVTTRVPTRRLFTSVGLCVLLSLPAVVVRFSGLHVEPVVAMLVFGAAVFAASFVLAWAAEAAQVDISGAWRSPSWP